MTTSESQSSSTSVLRQVSGSNLRRSTTVEPSSMASAKCAQPQVWNSGAATCERQPDFSGSRDSSAVAASMPASLRGAPFGVPVVPEVRMMMRLCLAGAAWSAGEPCSISDSSVTASSAGRVDPAQHPVTGVGLVDQPGELLVVHDDLGALAVEDVDELRAGERGVQVEDVGAELGGGDAGVHEPPVVAAHDRDAVAGAHAAGAERVREPVAALVQLPEGQLAELVDDAEPVRLQDRHRGEAAGRAGAPADQGRADDGPAWAGRRA